MPIPLQLLLLPLVIPIAYATGWCLPHLWLDIALWQSLSPHGINPTSWWWRRDISNYRALQWHHHLKNPLQPYPDLTT
jgi:hypothetical protein